MEKQVSPPVLPWQPALTTPPLVVSLLYLQNAQLSFKPALCLQEEQEHAGEGGRRVRVNSCMLGAFSLRLVIQPAVKYLSCKPSNALLRADEGQISKDDVRAASFDSTRRPEGVSAT